MSQAVSFLVPVRLIDRLSALPWRRVLTWLFVFTLLTHLPILVLVGLDPNRAFFGTDSHQYEVLATNLLDRSIFSLQTSPPYEPDIFRTPGYPLLMAAIYGVSGRSVLALAVVQVLFTACTAVLLASLAYRLRRSRAIAITAAVIWAITPVPALFSGMIAPETLFTSLLILTLYCLLQPDGSFRWWHAVLAGLAYGLAVLTRPIGIVLIPVLILAAFWRHPPRQWLRILVPGILAVGLVLMPWLVRNYRLYRQITLSSVGGPILLFYKTASVIAHEAGVSFPDGQELVGSYYQDYLQRHPEIDNPAKASQAMSAVAWEIILKRPIAFAWYSALDSLYGLAPGASTAIVFLRPGMLDPNTLTGSPAMAALGHPFVAFVTAVLTLFYVVFYVLSALGTVWLVRKRDWFALLTLLLLIAVPLYVGGGASSSRYRVPVEPYLALLAAEGIWTGVLWLKARRSLS